MIAITKKNQTLVNKAVKWLLAYHKLNDLRNLADDSDNLREFKKLDKQCAAAYERYLDICFQLPKREIKEIEKLFA